MTNPMEHWTVTQEHINIYIHIIMEIDMCHIVVHSCVSPEISADTWKVVCKLELQLTLFMLP